MECFFVMMALVIGGGVFYSLSRGRRVMLSADAHSTNHQSSRLQRQAPRKTGRTIEVCDGYMRIDDDYYPDMSMSSSRQYIVATSDGQYLENGGRTPGKVALFDRLENRLIWVVTMPRPHDPLVSNNGTVVVTDWGEGEDRKNSLVAFNLQADLIWRHVFDVHLLSSGMSRTGRKVFVSTAGGRYLAESNTTFVYDTATGELLTKANRTDDVRFQGEDLVIDVAMVGGGSRTFKFNAQGDLPKTFDKFRREQAELRAASDPVAALGLLKREFKSDSPDWDRVERVVHSALEAVEKLDNDGTALLLRYLGELLVERGDLEGAADAWRRALALNDRVGVKMKLQKLEKKLQAQES